MAKDASRTHEAPIWTWLLNLVETLGPDGMSSEESEVGEDDINSVYRVKVLPWRRNIERELSLIDSERRQAHQVFARSGAMPVRRIRRADNPVSSRRPRKGLPRSLYDDTWIGSVPGRSLSMEVSKARFKWMEIIADGDGGNSDEGNSDEGNSDRGNGSDGDDGDESSCGGETS
jgi:hypothetical protein